MVVVFRGILKDFQQKAEFMFAQPEFTDESRILVCMQE